MTFDELLATLHDLPRYEKIRAYQFLSGELAREDDPNLAEGARIPIWSPFDSYAAAKTLTEFLEQNPD